MLADGKHPEYASQAMQAGSRLQLDEHTPFTLLQKLYKDLEGTVIGAGGGGGDDED